MNPKTVAASPPEESGAKSVDWHMTGRVFLKAAVLLMLINFGFAALRPIDQLGRISIYNTLVPGRDRLPYGEVPSEDYNITLNNLPAMFASHQISRTKPPDEFRVVIIGDSGVWGWRLQPQQTLAAQLNRMNLATADGRRVVAYNLGYPVMSLTKDLLLLDKALDAEPDLIIWPVTLQSFARDRQLDHPLLQNNAGHVRDLIKRFEFDLDADDTRFVDRNFFDESLLGRRRDLADLLRLQGYGLAWAATGMDQSIPEAISLRTSDLKDDLSWLDIQTPQSLTEKDLTIDVLKAGVKRAGAVPVLLINEPMFVSDGANSDIRYNAFYPRWAYDQYRRLMADLALAEGWNYVDLWAAISPEQFTDTPVHLTPEGTRQLAELIAPYLLANR